MDTSPAELLEQDHSGIAELLKRVSRPDEDRPAVLRELVLRVAGHVTVESAVVLPELRRCSSGDDTPRRGVGGRRQAHPSHLALIERRKANSADMPDFFNEIRDVFDDHIQRCQQRLYPELERCLDDKQIQDLTEGLRSADHLVVENPHPHLLRNGPLAAAPGGGQGDGPGARAAHPGRPVGRLVQHPE
jgi:hypothetical protein